MDRDPYRHAHGHSQQPGNEWNDSRGMRAPNPGGVGGAWRAPEPGGGGGGGGGSGIGALVVFVVGAAVAIPAAVMSLVATPLLKLLAPWIVGRSTSFFSWLSTARTTLLGGMAYLGLGVLIFFVAEGYLSYGLRGIPSSLDGLAGWQQWLTSTGWAAAQVIEWVAHVWSAGAEYEEYGQLYPVSMPLGLMLAGIVTLHLPGLLAYAVILFRADYVGDGLRGLFIGLGVALVLVVLTLPLAVLLSNWAYSALRSG